MVHGVYDGCLICYYYYNYYYDYCYQIKFIHLLWSIVHCVASLRLRFAFGLT